MAFHQVLASWAAEYPQVRRLWLVNGTGANGLDVQLELRPVMDSEETLAVWLATKEQWRRELQKLVGSPVALECRDPDDAMWTREPGAGEARTLLYERST